MEENKALYNNLTVNSYPEGLIWRGPEEDIIFVDKEEMSIVIPSFNEVIKKVIEEHKPSLESM